MDGVSARASFPSPGICRGQAFALPFSSVPVCLFIYFCVYITEREKESSGFLTHINPIIRVLPSGSERD